MTLAFLPGANGETIDQGTPLLAARGEVHTDWTHLRPGDVVHWQTSADAYVLHIAEVRDSGLVDASDGGGLFDCMRADAQLEFRLRWENNAVGNPRDANVTYTIEKGNQTDSCPSSTEAIAAFRESQRPAFLTGVEPWLVFGALMRVGGVAPRHFRSR